MNKSNLGTRALKAYVAAGVAALAVLGTSLADGVVSAVEVVALLGSALAAWSTTYFVPNGTSPDPTTSTPEV